MSKATEFFNAVSRNLTADPPAAELGEKLRAIGTALDEGIAAAVRNAQAKARQ